MPSPFHASSLTHGVQRWSVLVSQKPRDPMSLRHAAVLAVGFSTILLSACGDDDPTPPQTPAFTLAVTPTTLSVQAGGVPTSIALASVASEADAALANVAGAAGTGTLNVAITRSGGFEGAVTIAVEGLPTGVTASALTIAPGLLTGTITITAAANATVGTATLTVRGTGTGVTAQTANVQLTITASPSFALTLTPTALSVQQGQSGTATANIARSGGFAGSVALTSTGPPAGVTLAFDPASATGATSAITVNVGASVAPGVYPITVQGASTGLTNQTAVLTLTVTAPPTPSVALSAAPANLSIAQGQSGSSTLTLARTNFTGAVALTSTGAPAGMTITFNPTSVTGTTSGITVDVGAAVTVGAYPIVIQGAGTGIANANVTLMVTVTAPPASSIGLSITPSALTIQTGASGTTDLTITRTNFTGAVALTSTGAPAGITVTFNPASVTGTTSQVTVAVGATVVAGVYPITLTGAGTGVADATTVLTVTVTAPSIALSVAPTTLSVAAAASGTSTVTLVRTSFTGDVALTSTGAPAGMTVTFNPATLTGTTLTSTATVAVGAAVVAGTYPITVQGAGTGVANATAVLTVTVTAAAGSIVLTTSPATLSIQQGGSGSSTLTIARTNFTGTVNLTSTGAPAGMTVSFNPAAATGTTSTVTVGVAASVAVGTYAITLTGAGTGITNATTALSVTVTAPGSGNVGLTFCAQTGLPLWVGYQDFGGAWTQAVGVNNVYSFNITTKGAIAWVLPVAGGKTSLQILYGTQAELSLRGTTQCVGSGALKAINVTAVGVGAADFASIAMNGGFATIIGATGTFTAPLQPGVRDGLVDLIGVKSTISGTTLTANSIVIQRDRNDATGTTVTVDFATGVAPVTQTATIGNLLGQQAYVSSLFFSKNGTFGSLFSDAAGASTSTTRTWQGVPAASVITGDYHLLSVFSASTTGLPFRAITQYNRLAADRTYTLPDAITTPPTITVQGTSPYVTLTTNWVIQSAQYNQNWSMSFAPTSGTVAFVFVNGTAGYFGSGPVQLAIPNFGSSFNPAHGLQPGIPVNWTFTALGGTLFTQPNGPTQLEGYTQTFAGVGGTFTP
jgi:uncharacterized membrane protein